MNEHLEKKPLFPRPPPPPPPTSSFWIALFDSSSRSKFFHGKHVSSLPVQPVITVELLVVADISIVKSLNARLLIASHRLLLLSFFKLRSIDGTSVLLRVDYREFSKVLYRSVYLR